MAPAGGSSAPRYTIARGECDTYVVRMKKCDNPICETLVGDRARRCPICQNYLRRTGRDRTRIIRHPKGGRAGPLHHRWKGADATKGTQRERVQTRVPLHRCERCGARAIDRHHVDGDTGNNSLGNVVCLCRRCHMIEDGRMARFLETGRRTHISNRKPPRPCKTCHALATVFWYGECHACNEYRRRRGVSRALYLASRGHGAARQPSDS